ncbi:succinylglutamate desuccinylase/aspartoacylase family protein [Reichenbachiella carrageenanivorans]|uniref:Succinylglutamate desuccinylase/aspartoacylase family protein n=1 Tax=Reichenbachiella carrageenanivorans TaxID=2979869 RepID=A0ABY6CZD8_9BACT|nr:succinylglutamate desuccinylase/aspartoacylase family protein [Reichenbachiella carrageenanivorans]UXX78153.1 succinylglutamate desuccinylase/aspartoacylase family protein [Reichenbachiella carrageenanivorans]
MTPQDFKIANVTIAPGEEKQIDAQVGKLPTRTPIDIPIIVHRSTVPGPTLLVTGGMHGDEINGIEIVRRIVAKGLNKPLIGSTICIPILNIYGFIHFSRQVTDGGKDINRSFPGAQNGSLASQLAYRLSQDILPLIDLGIDFHTGGARINNYPQIRAMLDDPYNFELAQAFSPKYIINSPFREKSFRKEAAKQGKSILVYEGGESQRLRKSAVDEGVNGFLRVMKHLKMTAEAPESNRTSILIKKSSWLRAKSGGIYHSFFRPGEEVTKGAVVGLITGPFGEFEHPMKAHLTGHVLSINNNPVINRGDALMHIGVSA